jgi:hypothetical protein
LLAEHGLKADAGVGEISFPIALHTNPMLGAATCGLILACGRNVVLCMACDHAGFASGTAIEVYCESPFMSHSTLPFLADGACYSSQAKSGLEWGTGRLFPGWENN